MKIDSGKGKRRERFAQFGADSVWFDKLVNLHAEDQEFLRSGGQIKYTPDHSLWASFFHPVRDGGTHKARRDGTPIRGFAEVFTVEDSKDAPYTDDAKFSSNKVSGFLGKLLMDRIFDPQDGDEVLLNGGVHEPDFFLTKNSKTALKAAVEFALKELTAARENMRIQVLEQFENKSRSAWEALNKDLGENPDDKQLRELATGRSLPGILNSGLVSFDDDNIFNLLERFSTYNKIGLFDWDYVEALIAGDEEDADRFDLSVGDIDRFEQLTKRYRSVLENNMGRKAPDSSIAIKTKIDALAEVLAINAVVDPSLSTRFIYLSKSYHPFVDCDGLYWNKERRDDPLVFGYQKDNLPSVSDLFIRHPICFLSDLELEVQDVAGYPHLSSIVDTLVPRKFAAESKRWEKRETIQKHLKKKLKGNQNTDSHLKSKKLDAYDKQLELFLVCWGEKKMPWVGLFLRQAAKIWETSLAALGPDGTNFHAFWEGLNRKLVQETWPLGIYLSMVTEGNSGRAAPLVYIDCDEPTDQILRELQEGVFKREFPKLQDKVAQFNSESLSRSPYFTYLVNAVVFMSANQFDTATFFATMATEQAYFSTERSITGREAYYLKSLLTRISAKNTQDLETARKLMLIANSKLAEDNRSLDANSQVSNARFDLEDWSRAIVKELFLCLADQNGKTFSDLLLSEYASYVTKLAEHDLVQMSGREKGASGGDLFKKTCDKAKFNFLVLCVMVGRLPDNEEPFGNNERRQLIGEWNKQFASKFNGELEIGLDVNEFRGLSTIEEAYHLAMACVFAAPESEEIRTELAARVSDFFGTEGTSVFDKSKSYARQEDIESASTSKIDKPRYEHLKKFCFDALKGESAREVSPNDKTEDTMH